MLLVSRSWCLCAFSLLWHKPTISKTSQLISLNRVLMAEHPTLPYAASIRRLNLANIAGSLSDELVEPFAACYRVERLTLTGAMQLTAPAISDAINGMPALVAVDLSHVGEVNGQVVKTLADRCERLQGLSLSGCKMVVDAGMNVVAERSRMLRRVSSILRRPDAR